MISSLLPFIVAGIATGAVYGLAACGITITYKTSGIFNFAHGAIAAAAAYLFYWLRVEHGMPWVPAFLVSVVGVGILFGLLFEMGARRISRQPVVLRIVATAGVVLAVQAIATIKFGPDPLQIDQYLPGGTSTFRAFGINIGWAQLTVAVFSLLVAFGLYLLFRLTRVGLSMRAVVDDSDLLGLHGASAVSVRRVAWIIGSTLSAASGVLLAPLTGIESIQLTYLVIAAAGAAAIGAFSSIPLGFAGGFLIGIVSDVLQKYVLTVPSLAGLPVSAPFLILLLVLLVTRRRKLVSPGVVDARPASGRRAPGTIQVAVGVIALVLLVLVPHLVGTNLTYYTQSMALAVMLLSLGLLARTAGQVSLCHSALAGVGAVAFSQLMLNLHLPWTLALVLGGLIVVPVAALVAIPAIRLSGLFLALATLAFGIVIERIFYPLSLGFTQLGSGRAMPRPSWGSSDRGFYYVALGIAVITALIMVVLDRSRLGRMLRGVSDSPTAIGTMGLGLNSVKVLVFCISGFFAGISGILYGSSVDFASYADPHYASFNSLILIAVLIIAPFQTPWYALFAVPATVIPAYVDVSNSTSWLNLIFGLSAILVALQGGAPAVSPAVAAAMERLAWHPRRRAAATGASSDADVPAASSGPRVTQPVSAGLEVDDVSVRFGGLKAVQGVSLEAPIGRITGLIGPNGAGKTTTFNSCSGLNKPTSGRIVLKGRDVTALSPAARARHGLGRTFQVTELCETLTVAGNVALGREAGLAGSNPLRQLIAGRRRSQEVEEAAVEAMRLCGILHLANEPASKLSTGERRLVEVARALAGDFDVLLLDEPSAGLDRVETARLGAVLTSVMEQRRCAILLVEHDMALVMRICEHIYVLDFGALLFEGPPADVTASPIVRSAYLGRNDSAGEIGSHVAEEEKVSL